MTVRQPPRLPLALLDALLPDKAPLRGDLVEEFHAGRSRRWLWGQVMAALLGEPQAWVGRVMPSTLSLVTVALVVLLSFEVVFVTNVVHQLIYGPSSQDVRGYLYLLSRDRPTGIPAEGLPLAAGLAALLRGLVVGLPLGWMAAGRLGGAHRRIALGAVMVGVFLWAWLHLSQPFSAQFLTMLSLTAGFLIGGSLAGRVGRHVQAS